MLSPVEQMIFILLTLFSLGAAFVGFREMYRIINRGEGRLHLDQLPARAWRALVVYVAQPTTLRARRVTSLLHLGVVWGFTFYFLVNLGDVLQGFIPGYTFLGETGALYDLYRLLADLLSVAVLVGVTYFILRRLVLPNRSELQYHDNVLLHPKVKDRAILTDSMIVAVFILLHVGARFLGEAVLVAQHGGDLFMPFASLVSVLFAGASPDALDLLRHLFWWIALGGILLFMPYFPYTKHAHLFMAPLNYLTRPHRTSMGEMAPLDLEDDEREQFGVTRLEDLSKTQIFDAFACIMCNRCQDVCPAYVTGKELSPSALEVNKRYQIRDQMPGLAAGEESLHPLLGSAISESAVWACTACGACIDICPVGNEPMFDILDIRRAQVLMEGEFPPELQGAFNGMERQGNPWQIAESRAKWSVVIDVPTTDDNPDFDILYWTGCAVSYDDRAAQTARAFIKIMQAAGVNFAILGDGETCTGDVARRAGNEALYVEMATANVETLNALNPKRIVTACPHCLHNLGKEYHQFGGQYAVIHHTELIEELIAAGRLPALAHPATWSNVTFHDPCYLGRHNGVLEEPRAVLNRLDIPVTEMPRSGRKSFCCGAGGAQFWKEEEHGVKPVNVERYEEARDTGADVLAVGCPFCMQMFESARPQVADGPAIKDIAELIAERLPQPSASPGTAVSG